MSAVLNEAADHEVGFGSQRQSTCTEQFSRNQRRVPSLCYLVTREICVHAQNHTAGIYSDTFMKPTRMPQCWLLDK
jgi:hypothetical protein